MRILFDARVVKKHLTGVEVYAIELLRRLADRPDARLAAICRDVAHATLVRQLTSPNLSVAIARRGMPIRLGRWLRKNGHFDLVHCPTPVFPFLQKPPGMPIVCTVHDVTPRFAPHWHTRTPALYFRWVLPRLMPLFDLFLADSRATADDLTHWYHVDPAQIHVVPLASRYSSAATGASPESIQQVSPPNKTSFSLSAHSSHE